MLLNFQISAKSIWNIGSVVGLAFLFCVVFECIWTKYQSGRGADRYFIDTNKNPGFLFPGFPDG
jgi:hypothetical protein